MARHLPSSIRNTGKTVPKPPGTHTLPVNVQIYMLVLLNANNMVPTSIVETVDPGI